MAKMAWITKERMELDQLKEQLASENAVERDEARQYVLDLIIQDYISNAEVEESKKAELSKFYPKYMVGVAYVVGEKIRYNEGIYEVIQSHTSQADWQPDLVPALYKLFFEKKKETDVATWVQPTGSHDSYSKGTKVVYNGIVYESTIKNNVWIPGVYGWVVV